MIGNYTAPYTQNPNIQGAIIPYNQANGTSGNIWNYESNQMTGGKRRKKSCRKKSCRKKSCRKKSCRKKRKRRSTKKRSNK